jgi:hypothetical protein
MSVTNCTWLSNLLSICYDKDMRRLAFIVFVLFAFFIVPRSYAATPTPGTSTLPPESTWTTGNCDGPAKAGDPPCLIAPDIADDRKVIPWENSACQKDLQGFLKCLESTFKEWTLGYQAAPDYKIGNWLQSADVKLNPAVVQEATVNNYNPQYESHATRRCIYDEKGILREDSNKVSDDIITIGPIYGIGRITQYAAAFSSRYSVLEKQVDDEGKYNFERKTQIIDKTQAHDCDYSRTGAPLPIPTPQATEGRISFNPFTITLAAISSAIGKIFKSTEVVVASKRTPYAEDMMGLSGQVTEQDLADSPVSAEKKNELVQTPGFIETFRPGSVSYRPSNINGTIVNSFTGAGDMSSNNTNTYMTNMLDRSARFLCNTLFPAAILPENCKIDLSSSSVAL